MPSFCFTHGPGDPPPGASAERWTPRGFVMLTITAWDDDIAGFALYGDRGARLLIDDVWITRPR